MSGGILQGNTSSLQGDILNNASVVFDQAFAGAYDGRMSGSGSLIKQNGGLLVLTGIHTYGGPTTVAGGELFVSGSIGGGVGARAERRRAGRHRIGADGDGRGAGGILAPGAPLGTLTVNGDVRLEPGSIYRVGTSRGTASLTQATGSIALVWRHRRGAGGKHRTLPSDHDLYDLPFSERRGRRGLRRGRERVVPGPVPPVRSHRGTLTLRRNDVDFRSVGTSGNQTAVALSLNALVRTATGPMADVINNVYDLSDRRRCARWAR